ncbi:RNA exonuclease 4 [Fasciola hepatica]|uniref:RNA exonuclease 4 n=1 Tax=Fasciola hepatica TaxID=6192 RepID=A0A4E0RCB4_FASHE|nr:RNA exonuclease 4 [Fasciola hepatica]
MTFDEQRIVAHTTVLSHASSPCGKYVVFGTNMQRLLVYYAASFFQRHQFECKPIKIVHLDISKSWHSLCASNQFLFCASHDLIWILRWCHEEQSILEKMHHIRLPSEGAGICCPVITNLLYDSLLDRLIVTTGIGVVHIYALGAQCSHVLRFIAHDSIIHGLCSAGENQFATCSEEGSVRFWETRSLPGGVNAQAIISFHPHQVSCLERPHLGRWLTTVSCDTSDWNWFVTGGGPSLSLWNRRAGRYVTPLHPDVSSDAWYAQTSVFSFPDIEPRIVAGGNSGHLYRWDHGGSLVSSLSLTDPPDAQLAHVMVIKPISAAGLPSEEENLEINDGITLVENHDNNTDLDSSPTRRPLGVLVVGGAGPAIRVISCLGYPLGTLTLY